MFFIESGGFMRYFVVLSLVFLSFGCISSPEPTGLAEGEVVSTKYLGDSDKKVGTKFRVETVASGLEVPWGFAFISADTMLFTERPGRVRLIEDGKLRDGIVFKVPDVEPSGESGLMDISLHPNFRSNKYVYLAYAYNKTGKQVKVVRYKFDGRTLTEDLVIINEIPAAPNHAGTRAGFGPDGKLYITTGDSTDWSLAQKTDSLAGKTLRLNDDGSIPKDNPFVGREDFRPEIYTLGHRNAQGLAWQPGTNLMFQTSHGPSHFEGRGGGADEVNIVEAGKNYGWPEIWGGKTKEGMVAPLLEYTPACAPASAMFYTGGKFPEFKGNLFFGCLRGVRIVRVKLEGRRVVGQEDLLKGNFGRIREMAESPAGDIYFSTSNRDGRGNPNERDDRILRIVPAK
jgi:aldose sugar dehydrogenase